MGTKTVTDNDIITPLIKDISATSWLVFLVIIGSPVSILIAAPAAMVSKYPIRLAIIGINTKASISRKTLVKNATVPSSAETGVIIIADNVYHDIPDAIANEPNKSILN